KSETPTRNPLGHALGRGAGGELANPDCTLATPQQSAAQRIGKPEPAYESPRLADRFIAGQRTPHCRGRRGNDDALARQNWRGRGTSRLTRYPVVMPTLSGVRTKSPQP